MSSFADTPLRQRRASLTTPCPGDLVLFPDGSPGRISDVGTQWSDTPSAHICHGHPRVHLRKDASVSVSGGPFDLVPLDRLVLDLSESASVDFWWWGDNSPGAGRGIDFTLLRPCFRIADEGER